MPEAPAPNAALDVALDVAPAVAPDVAPKTVSMADLAAEHIADAKVRESAHTVTIRVNGLAAFRHWLHVESRDLMSNDLMADFTSHLMNIGHSPGTAEMWGRASRTFLHWARPRGLASAVEMPLGVRSRRQVVKAAVAIDSIRLERFIQLVEAHIPEPTRTAVVLLPYTNASPRDLALLRLPDILPRTPFAELRRRASRTQRPGIATLLPPGCQRLGRYLRDIRPRFVGVDDRVFPNLRIQQLQDALADLAKFCDQAVTFTVLRRTYQSLAQVYSISLHEERTT